MLQGMHPKSVLLFWLTRLVRMNRILKIAIVFIIIVLLAIIYIGMNAYSWVQG